ncbi:MAG: polysaccharide export protein [Deltaproteobacteria bacterium]|nr:polysaccharide export protein [Deltaproteobacteria bacterium]
MIGCAAHQARMQELAQGPSQQVLTSQALSKMQAPDPNKELQQQLMVQASRASLVNYKDYQVGPEDQLSIIIFGQDNLSRELRVNGQGEIAMPLVGVVKVAGMTPQEVQKRLEELYNARFLVNPQITVTVKEFRHQRVAVTGAVAKPGSYEVIGPRTLLEVLSLAGGLASQTSSIPAGDVITVIRHPNAPEPAGTGKAGTSRTSTPLAETVVVVIDIRRLVSGRSPELNILVGNGDVVDVPFADTAYVMGAVKQPKSIAVKENLTVSQAVALAGGVDPLLASSSINIMRFDKQGNPTSIKVNLKSIIARNEPDIPIKGSDVVVVNESTVKMALYLFKSLIPQPAIPIPF